MYNGWNFIVRWNNAKGEKVTYSTSSLLDALNFVVSYGK